MDRSSGISHSAQNTRSSNRKITSIRQTFVARPLGEVEVEVVGEKVRERERDRGGVATNRAKLCCSDTAHP